MSDIQHIDPNMAGGELKDGTVWYDPSKPPFRVVGLAFFGKNRNFRRMPQDKFDLFEKVNKNLNFLGSHPAGGQVRFSTNSKNVYVRAKVGYPHDMCNMTPVAQCGFDLYAKRKGEDRYLFYGISNFPVKEREYTVAVTQRLKGENDVILNLPLYAPLLSLEIGLDEGASVSVGEEFSGKPFAVYGTSITQGGCVTRPGMCYTNLLSRKFNREVFNFGFSANGLGEYEMAELLRDLPELGLTVLDYEANAGSTGRLERSLRHFIEIIREKQRGAILVMSRIPFTEDGRDPYFGEMRTRLREFQKKTVDDFRAAGDTKIYFLDGYSLFAGEWEEYTVDFIHPTDIGHLLMAEGIAKAIQPIL